MKNWIENNGVNGALPPVTGIVDIKLNIDEKEWPGIEAIRYRQNPKAWDWQRNIGGVEITHYRLANS